MKNLLTAIVIALAFAFATPVFNASAATNEGTGPEIAVDNAISSGAAPVAAQAPAPVTHAPMSKTTHTTHHMKHHTTSTSKTSSTTSTKTTTHHHHTHHTSTSKKPVANTTPGTDNTTTQK